MKEPLWLTGELVETVHANLIRLFGGHFGFLNENRLEAVLARPINRWKYEQDADLPELAAAYGFGFAKNRVFIDGNKRVAFMALYIFLGLNGNRITAPETEVADTMIRLAGGAITEKELADWLRTNTETSSTG